MPGEPAVDRGAELGLAAQPGGERDVVDAEAEAAPQLGERAELVELAQAVLAVAGRGARGDDKAGVLEVAEHPGRPARARAASPTVARPPRNLTTSVSRSSEEAPPARRYSRGVDAVSTSAMRSPHLGHPHAPLARLLVARVVVPRLPPRREEVVAPRVVGGDRVESTPASRSISPHASPVRSRPAWQWTTTGPSARATATPRRELLWNPLEQPAYASCIDGHSTTTATWSLLTGMDDVDRDVARRVSPTSRSDRRSTAVPWLR